MTSEDRDVRYFTLDKGDMSHTELASLYLDKTLIGSVQLNYFTNGILNIAGIERVKIKNFYQNNDEHYGSFMMHDVMQHIAGYKTSWKASNKFEGRLASDADNLDDLLAEVDNRGIDRVILNCQPELESFYERFGFQKTDDMGMTFDIHKLGYSSLN